MFSYLLFQECSLYQLIEITINLTSTTSIKIIRLSVIIISRVVKFNKHIIVFPHSKYNIFELKKRKNIITDLKLLK